MKDYVDIVEVFRVIAEENVFIKKFEEGRKDEEQITFDSFDMQFPIMWINAQTFTSLEYAFQYNVEVDIFSMTQDSGVDATQTISDCNAIMLDVINKLRYDYNVSNTTINPYYWKETTGELMAGVTAVITLEVGTVNTDCQVFTFFPNDD